MPRKRTILRQIASHQFIRTVYRAWVQTARGYSTAYPREVTNSTWVLLCGFFYTLTDLLPQFLFSLLCTPEHQCSCQSTQSLPKHAWVDGQSSLPAREFSALEFYLRNPHPLWTPPTSTVVPPGTQSGDITSCPSVDLWAILARRRRPQLRADHHINQVLHLLRS